MKNTTVRWRELWRSRVFRWASLASCLVGVLLLGVLCEQRHARELTRLLDSVQCAPLSVRDRSGQPVAELRSLCAARGRFVPLRDVPLLLQQLVIASEDSRFELHRGVDVTAVARALRSNVRSLRVVSGASTLTMQLARLLRAAPHTRAWSVKLQQAWDALTLERLLSKPEILEAYFNLAYYGAGAYGAADAARNYFGRELAALDDAELTLIALLPRAPELYNLKRHPERALRRRKELVGLWVARGVLQPSQARVIEESSLRLAAATASPVLARHFVDWVVAELPPPERKRGGVLLTTLDLSLQQQAELLVREHVDKLAARGLEEAAVVVLDARSAEVRAMVGSYAFERSQLNAITRRRQLGSLLKPFVYGLAIEAGAAPESIVADVGDVPSSYRSRDWVGREAGPLSYREALAGSYNLAAIHVLERVGVGALHQVLRRAGVAELASAPEAYGLPLALGAARVRLLDVAAGYGFMARAGVVRRASGSVRIERADGSVWRPEPARDVALFSARASAQVAGILADPAARHRRFGRGLPIDASEVDLGEADVALKTGTASGMADLSAILVSSEFIVAAWSGRFDGQPTRGLSGMWGALPLARRVLHAALMGRRPMQVARAASVSANAEPAAALSGARDAALGGARDVALGGARDAALGGAGDAALGGARDAAPRGAPSVALASGEDGRVGGEGDASRATGSDVSRSELAPWAERARARLSARIHER